MSAVRFVLRIAIVLMAGLPPAVSWAAEPLPRSVLILDQSDADSAWYAALSPAFRSTLNAGSPQRISVYAEHLDLSRFQAHSTTRSCAAIFGTSFATGRSACSWPRDRHRLNS